MGRPQLFACLVLATVLALGVNAQRTTYFDEDAGETVVASVQTDADGDPTGTRTLIRLTGAADDDAAAPATTTVQNNGQDFNYATCTTEGCPVEPTTYTQVTTIAGQESSMLYTWYATTPITPVPSDISTGSIMAASNYITTYASGVSPAAAGNRINQRSAASPAIVAFADQAWVMAGAVAIVGGLVGAAAVL
ncbi:hypothetical protein OIO90_002534 [Microbotryomycetes sp. JL221]|nr:hypothetical protein OIO90_002534 [Microbotryomycetes sp. JL221]